MVVMGTAADRPFGLRGPDERVSDERRQSEFPSSDAESVRCPLSGTFIACGVFFDDPFTALIRTGTELESSDADAAAV